MLIRSNSQFLRSCASLWTLPSKHPPCHTGRAHMHGTTRLAASTTQADAALQRLGLEPWSGYRAGIEKACDLGVQGLVLCSCRISPAGREQSAYCVSRFLLRTGCDAACILVHATRGTAAGEATCALQHMAGGLLSLRWCMHDAVPSDQ